MVIVKVELHSAITKRVTELTRMTIANDGTGTKTVGNYDVSVARTARRGKVRGYRREAHHPFRLVMQALAATFPEERCKGAEPVLDAEVMGGLKKIALAYIETLPRDGEVPADDIQAALLWLTDDAAQVDPEPTRFLTPGLERVLG